MDTARRAPIRPTGLRSLRTRRTDGAGPVRATASATVVLLPHAGGNPASYRSFAEALPVEVDVVGYCYPGRLDRLAEPPLEDVGAIADAVASELRDLVPRCTAEAGNQPGERRPPLVLVGHSMGSYVALEAALRLERDGGHVALVVASGSRPPHRVRPRHVVAGGAAAVVADAVRLDPSCRPVFDDPDLRDLVLPALLADYAAVETYRRADVQPLGCPVVSYAGADDPVVSPADVAGWGDWSAAPTARAGGPDSSRGGRRHRTFAGGHFFVTTDAAVPVHLGELLLQLG